MTFIQYVDSLVENEISDLTARISSADEILVDFNNLLSSITSIKSKLDESKDYSNNQDYLAAYKFLIDSLTELLQLNSQILSRLILLKSYQSNTNANSKD